MRIFAALLLGFSLWACDTFTTCETGAVCTVGDTNSVTGPSIPTPSPTPSLSPGATPSPCRIEAVRVGFHSGAQIVALPLGTTATLDATPVNSSGAVADGCNITRTPVWAVLTPATCQIIGGGFNPNLRGLAVGVCSLTVTVESVISAPFSVEVR